MGNEHELVKAVDAQTLIKSVKFLKKGKAPSSDAINSEVLRLGTSTLFCHHLARLFYLFHPARLHPNCMENSYPLLGTLF